MDYDKLNAENDKDIIIPRAMYATTAETFDSDIHRLEAIYSRKEILHFLKDTKELISNEVCSMVAKRYNAPAFFRFSKI